MRLVNDRKLLGLPKKSKYWSHVFYDVICDEIALAEETHKAFWISGRTVFGYIPKTKNKRFIKIGQFQ